MRTLVQDLNPRVLTPGLELSQRGGLGLTGGYKWASGQNLGISYNTNNGFGVNGGWGGDAFDDSLMSGQGGLSFGISQRGGYNVGATLDPSKLKGFGLGVNYVNGPGDNDGVGIAARFDGKQLLNYDMSTGQFTPAKAGALADTFIKEMLAAEQKAKLLRKHLLKANEQLGRSDFTNVLAVLGGNPELLAITRDGEISESEWNALSKEQKEALYKALEAEEAVHDDHGDSQGDGILEDLWNSAVNGFYGILGGGGDQWGYVDAQGKYHRRTCFVAGTLVVTEEGFRPIEEIKAGDVVLSWNEKSGELGYNKVAQTFVRSTELIYQITYADGTFIETTWNHPFYIKGRGWVQAKDLRDGDLSLTSSSIRGDSEELRISSIVTDKREDTVYNFEVSQDHTYFVTGMGVLVHNRGSSYGSNKLKQKIRNSKAGKNFKKRAHRAALSRDKRSIRDFEELIAELLWGLGYSSTISEPGKPNPSGAIALQGAGRLLDKSINAAKKSNENVNVLYKDLNVNDIDFNIAKLQFSAEQIENNLKSMSMGEICHNCSGAEFLGNVIDYYRYDKPAWENRKKFLNNEAKAYYRNYQRGVYTSLGQTTLDLKNRLITRRGSIGSGVNEPRRLYTLEAVYIYAKVEELILQRQRNLRKIENGDLTPIIFD